MEYSLEEIYAALNDKRVISWCDLYEKLGIAAILKTRGRYDVEYVLANAKTQQTIRNKIKENLENKYKNSYKKRTIDAMEGLDFLCYSPTTKENVEGIKIVLEK